MTTEIHTAARARFHFWARRHLCRWRHDYEPIAVTADGVLLECFYCERRKLSRVATTATEGGTAP